ncbi:hypothetical protein AVEN_53161-1 [Araneus ventricosus]|uniref:STPR domain-containing protein n=1 Tax=Araneus ventricosus TaxID=182803 RepID=A0A4Y2A9K8_ARAVE|nr:hypothetical protein AVEN_53161-1 [Araneus ventricosus]
MAQRGQKRRAEETEEQRNRGLSHMAQRGLERKTEETEEQRNSRLSDMAQRSQERRAKEIRRTKEWSIDYHSPQLVAICPWGGPPKWYLKGHRVERTVRDGWTRREDVNWASGK